MEIFSFKKLNIHITSECKRNKLILRRAGNGLWLSFIIPAALLSSFIHFSALSEVYKIISILSIGQFINSICKMMHNDKHSINNNIPYIPIGYLLSSTILSLLLVFFTDRSIIYILCVTVGTSFSYSVTLEKLVRSFPRSFTYGEAVLVSQSLILFLTCFITNITSFTSLKYCEDISCFIVQTGYVAVLFILFIANTFPKRMQNTFTFFIVLGSSFFIFVILVPLFIIQINSVSWLLQLINNFSSIMLIIFWSFGSLCAIYCLSRQIKQSKPVSSATRKSFHFLMFFILVPGLLYNSCLMYIASGVAFALLIVIEIMRKLKLTNYYQVLQLCFDTFKDSKDEGQIALTPLYLMIGCAAPLWIYPFKFFKFNIPLSVLSGVLTVGIGDAVASIYGTHFGRHKWKNSSKTKEGTFFCLLSQVIVLLLLNLFDLIEETNILWCTFVIAVTSIIEAKSDQIDNLVLPFVAYTLFNINS